MWKDFFQLFKPEYVTLKKEEKYAVSFSFVILLMPSTLDDKRVILFFSSLVMNLQVCDVNEKHERQVVYFAFLVSAMCMNFAKEKLKKKDSIFM